MSNQTIKSAIRKVRTHISQNEGLIFEKSSPGSRAFNLPPSDIPPTPIEELIPKELLRSDDLEGFPEVSEPEIVRHYTRLSTWNYGTDTGMFPLGSCTMKYNPKINELVARLEGFSNSHPLAPEYMVQGNLQLIKQLEDSLCEITGLPAISLQPVAGAHAELTGVMIIQAALKLRGDVRKKILIPDSAHGTNPASAVMCGYRVETISSDNRGLTNVNELEKKLDNSVAAIMLTNPNTLGLFEENIELICKMVHACGGFVYMDGANMNALCGITRPGDMGIDVMHLNLHKTFSTPHGGGGPGCGPVLTTTELEPFLPFPIITKDLNSQEFRFDYDRPRSIGRVRAYYGNFGMMVRALAYILALGAKGLKTATEIAVLNANYIAYHLKDTYELPFPSPILHEVVFSDKRQQKFGVKNSDIAKRLIDYGFHPPTMSFPLIAPGAIMIEPTESENREEIDLFIDAMKSISAECENNPELVKTAPHNARIGRIDEVSAARNPILKWQKNNENC